MVHVLLLFKRIKYIQNHYEKRRIIKMVEVRKRHCLAVFILALVAFLCFLHRCRCACKAKRISEATRQATKESGFHLDCAIDELKKNLEGKSAEQLDRSLDSIVENTKSRIDKIANQLKNKVHSEQE